MGQGGTFSDRNRKLAAHGEGGDRIIKTQI